MVRRKARPLPVVSCPPLGTNGGEPLLNRALTLCPGLCQDPPSVHGRWSLGQPEIAPLSVQLSPLYQKMRNEPNKSCVINKTLEERTQMFGSRMQIRSSRFGAQRGKWKLETGNWHRQPTFQFPFSGAVPTSSVAPRFPETSRDPVGTGQPGRCRPVRFAQGKP